MEFIAAALGLIAAICFALGTARWSRKRKTASSTTKWFKDKLNLVGTAAAIVAAALVLIIAAV